MPQYQANPLDLQPAQTGDPTAAGGISRPAPSVVEMRLITALWRWHFWSGLLTAPVLCIIALTGAMYGFKYELEPLLAPRFHRVIPTGSPQSTTILLKEVERRYPKAQPVRLWVSHDPARARRLTVRDGDQAHTLYLDPYRGVVTGAHKGRDFFDWVLHIHRRLMLGTLGRLIGEMATSWGLISLVTGLYLWWPRGRNRLWGVFLPRLNAQPRRFARDLHAVLGLYFAGFIAAILFTGLLFTKITGTLMYGLPAVTGQLPHAYLHPPKIVAGEGDQKLALDQILNHASALQPLQSYLIRFPKESDAALIVDWRAGARMSRRAWLNPWTGECLATVAWQDLTPTAKALLLFYPIHSGELLGLSTKIAAVLTSLAVVLISLSGMWLWWDRAKKGQSFPKALKNKRQPRWLTAIQVTCLILLPAAGLGFLLWWACILAGRRLGGSLTIRRK